jgi:hypothetical protein
LSATERSDGHTRVPVLDSMALKPDWLISRMRVSWSASSECWASMARMASSDGMAEVPS